MKTLFISNQIPDILCSIFTDMGLNVVLLPPDPSLPEPVSCHADMLMFGNILQKDYYKRNKELFGGYDIVLAEEKFGKEYPKDVLLNAFAVGDTLFGRLESVSVKIKEQYPKAVNLRQGYAKCSTLLFGNNAITADKGIGSVLTEHGLNVLIITSGHIALPGYDYGFIGGASFVYKNIVYFFGDLEKHPDCVKICNFIEDAGYVPAYDIDYPLTDFGGAIILDKKH